MIEESLSQQQSILDFLRARGITARKVGTRRHLSEFCFVLVLLCLALIQLITFLHHYCILKLSKRPRKASTLQLRLLPRLSASSFYPQSQPRTTQSWLLRSSPAQPTKRQPSHPRQYRITSSKSSLLRRWRTRGTRLRRRRSGRHGWDGDLEGNGDLLDDSKEKLESGSRPLLHS